jgi:hypothetical protein
VDQKDQRQTLGGPPSSRDQADATRGILPMIAMPFPESMGREVGNGLEDWSCVHVAYFHCSTTTLYEPSCTISVSTTIA